MVSMKDVSIKAGVSIATVSNVINKTKYVSEEKVQLVQHAIKKLGYVPNAFAKGLKTKRSGVISLILHDTFNPQYMSLVNSVTRTAQESGYSVMIHHSDRSVKKEEEALMNSVSNSVDGIILDPVGLKNEYIKQILQQNIPIVFAGLSIRGVNAPCVLANIKLGTYEAITHLIKTNHRHIGFVTNALNTNLSKESFEGYKKALEDYNITMQSEYIKTNASSHTGGYKAVTSLLMLSSPPSAILVADELMTHGAIEAINVAKADADVELIGLTNNEWSNLVKPKISVISLPTSEIGKLSTEIIIDMINGIKPNVMPKEYLSTELFIKNSDAHAMHINTEE